MSHARSTVVLLLMCLMFVACDKHDTQPAHDGSAADTMQLAPGAAPTTADTAAAMAPDTSAPLITHIATVSTDSGEFQLDLYGRDADKAVRSFVGLAKKGYFDGLAFHRVVPGFVIQAGDPQTRDTSLRANWGKGGESAFGKPFQDELDTNAPSARRGYVEGTLAMANSGPNTNGSQFFIVLSDQGGKDLQFKYTIFGHLRSGLETVRRIETTGYQGEMPLTPARIRKITIEDLGTKMP